MAARKPRPVRATATLRGWSIFTDTFPTTATGKVQKFKLREMAEAMLPGLGEVAS